MEILARSIAVALVLAACGRPAPTTLVGSACDAGGADREAAQLSAEGYLGRALIRAREAARRCPSERSRQLLESLRAELGLPGPPPPTDPEEMRAAVLLYQEGVNLRVQARPNFDGSVRQLERSFARAPHPLTLVQVGLSHEAAGRPIEMRKAYARALALAEEWAGGTAFAIPNTGHAGVVNDIVAVPGGRKAVTAGSDGTVRVWDLSSGRQVGLLASGMGAAPSVAVSPDGARAAAVDATGAVRFFELGAGRALASARLDRWAELAGTATAIAFSPDGARVAATVLDFDRGATAVLDAIDARVIREHARGGSDVAYAGAGTLAVLTHLGLSLIDEASGAVRAELPLPWSVADCLMETCDLAVSPDGQRIAVTGGTTLAEIDARAGRISAFRNVGIEPVTAVAFAPNGDLVVAGNTGVVLVPVGGGVTASIDTGRDRRSAVAVTGDGTRALVATELELAAWDLGTGARSQVLGGVAALPMSVALGVDGTLAIGSADGPVLALDAERRSMRVFTGHTGQVNTVVLASSGRLISAGDERVIEWDRATGAIARALDGGNALVDLAVSSDAEHIATLADDGAVSIWNSGGNRVGSAVGAGDPVSFGFHGDRLIVAGRGADEISVVWDPRGGGRSRPAFHVENRDGKRVFVLSEVIIIGKRVNVRGDVRADGALIAVPDGGRVALRAPDGSEVVALDADPARVHRARFAPDGTLLTAGRDGLVKIWRAPGERPVRTFSGHTGPVFDVAIDVTGTVIATAGADHTVRLWDATEGRLLTTVISTPTGAALTIGADGHVELLDAAAAALLYWQAGEVQLPGFVGLQRQFPRAP